jgi:hypothetical protein
LGQKWLEKRANAGFAFSVDSSKAISIIAAPILV